MRFVQVHTFYESYLKDFYAAHPGLAEKPYKEQLETILEDGFAASHLQCRELNAEGFDAQFLLANCPELQLRWAFENGVYEVTQRDWVNDILRKQLATFKADVLYITNPIDFDSRFVRSLERRPTLVMGWRAANIPAYTDFSEFDLMLSSDPYSMETLRKQGAKKVLHFLPGFPEWIAEKVSNESKLYDVSFCGQVTPEHARRIQLLELIASEANRLKTFTPTFFLHQSTPVPFQAAAPYIRASRWGLPMHREIIRGKVGFNCVIDFAKGEAGNMRQFEVTGTGSFLLTEYHEKLKEQFVLGSEVETYRSTDELIEKIVYFANHDSEREAIAKRGQARCFHEHGMRVRAKQLAELIRKELGSAPPPKEEKAPPAYTLTGSLGEVLQTLAATLSQYPRRTPGELCIEGRSLSYADLHSFYHQAMQIFGQKLYDFKSSSDTPTIIDCGGHIGMASLYFKQKYPQSHIITFEADPQIAEKISFNMQSFGVHGVDVQAKAVWIHNNGVRFATACDDSGTIGTEGTLVPSIRLKDLLSKYCVEAVKMDIEGAEFDVIKDCKEVLRNARCYMIETHMLQGKNRLGELLSLFEETGFHYSLGDLQHTSWIPNDEDPPFGQIKHDKFLVTVFAWRR